MSTNQHFVVIDNGDSAPTVFSYKNASLAAAAAAELNGVAATDAKMGALNTALLVKLHNAIRPDKPVKKFQDRETAEKRLKGVMEVLAKVGPAPKNAPVKAARTSGGERPGRVSAFAGKKIIKLVDANPRREGTIGFQSWESFRSGTTYETYIANGGRRQDLKWDLDRKYVKLETA